MPDGKKDSLKRKGLKVNTEKLVIKVRMKRAKGLVSKIDPCSICIKMITSNSIECTACKA